MSKVLLCFAISDPYAKSVQYLDLLNTLIFPKIFSTGDILTLVDHTLIDHTACISWTAHCSNIPKTMTLKVRAALKEINFNCKIHQKLFHISNQVLVEVAFCPTCIWTTFKSYMGHFEPLSPILWSLLSKQILITAEIGCAPVCLVQIHFVMPLWHF